MKKNYSAEKRTNQTVKKSSKSNFLFFLLFIINVAHANAQSTGVYIPDVNFKNALLDNMNINTNGDTEITPAEAANFTGTIYVGYRGIADLTGIEAFVNITRLYCDNNALTSLDVSANTALTYLYCFNNALTSLDVSANTALTWLHCFNNDLTSLDVATNTALTSLLCSDNALTSLDVSANTALTYLSCYNNDLTSLDVAANTALINLKCSSNALTSLDVSANTALIYLYCSSNALTSLDVAANTALTYLKCSSNALTSLDVAANTALTSLYCDDNALTSLNLANGNNTNLGNFNAKDNPNLHCIQVDDVTYSNTNWTGDIDTAASFGSGNVNLPDANFKNALVNNMNINTNGDTEISSCEAANFTGTIDVGFIGIADLTGIEAFVNITGLDCGFNALTSLDVSANTALTSLDCVFNDLTSLDVSANTALSSLHCYYNDLTSLDVAANTALTSLYCFNNALTSLDVATNTALTTLYCDDNALTSLDVSANTALTTLYCDDNALTSLDVSANTALEELGCSSNALTSLDVSANTALTTLDCGSNALTSLNLANGNNTNLGNFYAKDNPNLNCIQVDDVTYSNTNWTGDIDTAASFGSGNVNLPDAIFKNALVNNMSINTNGDTEISSCEAANFTGTLDVGFIGIADLTGIEAFVNITRLDCYNNALTSLDVSANTALTTLFCWSNQLTSLDVSANTALTSLLCVYNDLTSLNVANGNNTNFGTFYAFGNPNLNCIQVDDVTYSNTNWANNIGATASFSTNCAYPSNSSTATSYVASISSFTNTNAFTETVRVSPNPVVHTFSITGSASFTLKQAKVYDVLGKELISTTTNEVDASSLPNGMYIVRIESTDGKIEAKKIIKK